MNTTLELESGVSSLADYVEGDFLKSAKFGFINADNLCLEFSRRSIHGIHSVKVRTEKSRLLAACTLSELDNNVSRVVGVFGHKKNLQLLGDFFNKDLVFLKFLLGKLAKLGVKAGFMHHFLRLTKSFLCLLILPEFLNYRFKGFILLDKLGISFIVSDDLGKSHHLLYFPITVVGSLKLRKYHYFTNAQNAS